MTDSNTAGNVKERSTCCTVGCHREPVVIHSHAPGGEPIESERTALCLPCRRVVEYARRIPWGDESESWTNHTALETWIEQDEPVVAERYIESGGDAND